MSTHRLNRTVAALLLAATAATAQAGAVFSTDRNAYLAAGHQLTLEDFERANVAPGTDATFTGVLSVNTNNAIFATGDVVVGFAIEAIGSDSIYVSRDFAGNTGANVSSNVFTENMNVYFTTGITAVALDLLQWHGQGGEWAVEAYDLGGNLLGSLSSISSGFIGLTSDVAIARLFLDKPDVGAVIDNLRFGVAGGTVPEPSTLLLAGAAALALRFGALRRRKSG